MSVEGAELARRVELLRKTPVFSGLSESLAQALAKAGKIIDLQVGQTLYSEGESGRSMFLILAGEVEASLVQPEGDRLVVGALGQGDLVGEIALLGGQARAGTIQAKTATRVLELPHGALAQTVEAEPALLERAGILLRHRLMVVRLRTLMSKLFPGVPIKALMRFEKLGQWMELERGDGLFEQGEPSDCVFLVLGGSIGKFRIQGAETRFLGEQGRGHMVGTKAMLLGERRSCTGVALRKTTVYRFEQKHVEQLVVEHPRLSLDIMRQVFGRKGVGLGRGDILSAKRLALLSTHPSIDLDAQGEVLRRGFSKLGSALVITVRDAEQACDVRRLGALGAGHPHWNRVALWLERLSDTADFILMLGQHGQRAWNHWVSAQSENVLALAPTEVPFNAAATRNSLPPRGSQATEMSARASVGVQGELIDARRAIVLVHPPNAQAPRKSSRWKSAASADRVFHMQAGRQSDADRVARILAGRATGLVLGGGGARGFVHVGVYKALREHGIAVDAVGGTSMGSIIASQIAAGHSVDEIVDINRRCVALNPFGEYTLPVVSFVKSARIEQVAQITGDEADIEDLWLDFYAISTDLTQARMVIHDRGPVWSAIRASGALPGIVRPVIQDGRLLVDGGLLNNLPTDVMRRRCGPSATIIGVNASPESDVGMPKSAFPSPYSMAWQYIRGSDREGVPNMGDILMRSFVLSSVMRLEETRADADVFIAPDVAGIGMLDFAKLDELVELGYREAARALERGDVPAELRWDG